MSVRIQLFLKGCACCVKPWIWTLTVCLVKDVIKLSWQSPLSYWNYILPMRVWEALGILNRIYFIPLCKRILFFLNGIVCILWWASEEGLFLSNKSMREFGVKSDEILFFFHFFCCVILVSVPYFTCVKITNTPCVLAMCRDFTVWIYFVLPTVLWSMGTRFPVPQMWKRCTETLSDGRKATQCLNPSGCEVQAFSSQAIVAS